MPTARKEIANAAVNLNDVIYVIGGVASEGSISTAVETYDVANDQWSTVAALPDAVWRSTAAASDGLLYVFGGYQSTASFPFDPSARSFVYDPATDIWTEIAAMPQARGAAAAVAEGGVIHVLGGASSSALTRHDVYDPVADSWSTGTAIPTARSGLTASFVAGEILVVGGYFLNGGVVSQTVVEAYDPVGDTWRTVQSLPETRHGIAAASVNDRLYVFGGVPNASMSRALEYDPVGNSWRELTEMPTPVSFMGAAAASDGNVYVIGGGPVNLDRFDAVAANRVLTPPAP